MSNVTTNTVPFSALEVGGFMPSASDVLTPKQKDIFGDFPSITDGLSGGDLNKELETAATTEPVITNTEPAKTDDAELPTPKGGVNELEKLTNELTAEITKPVDTTTPPDKEEITGKRAMVKYLKKKIEAGEFQAYDDFDEGKQKLSDYLNNFNEEELESLIDTNRDTRETTVKEQYRQEFFQSLPGHLQFVARHLAEGTVPAEDIYAALLRTEQSLNLNPADENDQATIARNYLAATNFGTQDEINAQVEEWREADTLGKKATQFKPKLDNMQEQQVAAYARQADEAKVQQQEAARWYAHSVETALADGDLGGLKISRKQQKQLYDSLLLDVKPSVRDGRPMNGLWQALEHIQMVEPDFKRLAEITWLATDPKGYRESLIQQGRNEQQSNITKQLKTLQGSGAISGQGLPEQKKRPAGIVKQKVNPFDK